MQLEDYLKNANYFSLGHLPTESFHPLTQNLSHEVHSNLAGAIEKIQTIDLNMLEVVKLALPVIQSLAKEVEETLNAGGTVFLSGCGATGRLALTLESLYRKIHHGSSRENKVQALMAGGDYALVKSVENFEDYPEYGQRHLISLGFKDSDLLIAITEGGETPYVIGTVHGALSHSSREPWFVYCNPTHVLAQTIERSRELIENPRVKLLCLDTGPMALSGSTRLQAASSQMLAVGMALACDINQMPSFIDDFIEAYSKINLAAFLGPAIQWEASAYVRGEGVLYQSGSYPIAVLTDTTERSPTFSLTPFEDSTALAEPYSLCYLSIPSAKNALESWVKILNRPPLGLEWPELEGRLAREAILKFDFSQQAREGRAKRLSPQLQKLLKVEASVDRQSLSLMTDDFSTSLKTKLLTHPLAEQLLIKLILNTHSLMVMGLLNRYEGNVMTWVRASNGKLIDRTARYLESIMLRRRLPALTHDEIIGLIFHFRELVKPDEALILKILNEISFIPSAND